MAFLLPRLRNEPFTIQVWGKYYNPDEIFEFLKKNSTHKIEKWYIAFKENTGRSILTERQKADMDKEDFFLNFHSVGYEMVDMPLRFFFNQIQSFIDDIVGFTLAYRNRLTIENWDINKDMCTPNGYFASKKYLDQNELEGYIGLVMLSSAGIEGLTDITKTFDVFDDSTLVTCIQSGHFMGRTEAIMRTYDPKIFSTYGVGNLSNIAYEMNRVIQIRLLE